VAARAEGLLSVGCRSIIFGAGADRLSPSVALPFIPRLCIILCGLFRIYAEKSGKINVLCTSPDEALPMVYQLFAKLYFYE